MRTKKTGTGAGERKAMPRFRRGASALSTLLVAMAVILVSGACGSGAIGGPEEASEQGGATQDSTAVIEPDGSDGTTATDSDDSDETPTSTSTIGEPPTTLAPGSAGVSTDAGGNQIIILPGCVVNVTERVESQQYAALRRELRCILDNPAAVPDEVLDAARVADALAKERLTEGETEPGSNPAAPAESGAGEAETDPGSDPAATPGTGATEAETDPGSDPAATPGTGAGG